MKRILTIQLEDNTNDGDKHADEVIVARVLELIEEGFTSGIEPTWEISETE